MTVKHETMQEIKNAKTPGQAAAIWWAAELKPGIESEERHPMLAMLTARSKRSSPSDNLKAFEAKLAEEVDSLLQGANRFYPNWVLGHWLSVDHNGPSQLLQKCADQAGVLSVIEQWEWGTYMHITPDEVTVEQGHPVFETVIWTMWS